MPFTSMAVAVADGVVPEGPESSVGSGSDGADGEDRSPDEDAGTATEHPSDPEATIASLEAERDRLLAERERLRAERSELRARYEQLLQEERNRPSEPIPPADDGLLLRIARRLGFR